MDRGTQKSQSSAQGNRCNERTDHQTIRQPKAGRKQKPRAPEPVIADMLKILVDHFFPDFNDHLSKIEDSRRSDRIVYSKEFFVWLGLSMFLSQCGSRNQLENERRSTIFLQNLLSLTGTDEEQTSTTQAMNDFMESMDPTNTLELLPGEMTKSLIRARVLDKYRNSNGEFMVAVDGVHLHTKKGRHPNAVYKKINGETYSFYYALEAKIVGADGIGLSLATVFIENEEDYVKQDCELKAFYRLAKILKERFPRLRICLLLDGLYPNENVLKICEENYWSYFISLQDGNLPLVHKEANKQMKRHQEQSHDHSPEAGVYQHLSWAVNLKHKGQHTHLIICKETKEIKKEMRTSSFVLITDNRPNKNNITQLAKEGRCRWNIEEMFNIQKNGGYELEHNFGMIGHAMKNYYYLLQIAHMLHQLMVRSDLFPKLQKKFIAKEFAELPHLIKLYLAVIAKNTLKHFRTIKNFVRRFAESFRYQKFSELATNPEALGKIQIRWDTS